MKKQLTPFDTELMLMVHSLLGEEPFAVVREDHFEIICAYKAKKDNPDLLNATIEAIKGRLGVRFIEVTDEPDFFQFIVKAKYSDDEYPKVIGDMFTKVPQHYDGETYCHKLEECKAVQVERVNLDKLRMFCGNGEMTIERRPNGIMTFSFVSEKNGMICTAQEHDYIIKHSQGNIEIAPKKVFENNWEKKY